MVNVRAVSVACEGSISFTCSDMEFAGELMRLIAETATDPIAFTVSFDQPKEAKEEKSRFINPEGGKDE